MPVVPAGSSASGLASRERARTSAARSEAASATPRSTRTSRARRTARVSAAGSLTGSARSRRASTVLRKRRAPLGGEVLGPSSRGLELAPGHGARRRGERTRVLVEHLREGLERLPAFRTTRLVDEKQRSLERREAARHAPAAPAGAHKTCAEREREQYQQSGRGEQRAGKPRGANPVRRR